MPFPLVPVKDEDESNEATTQPTILSSPQALHSAPELAQRRPSISCPRTLSRTWQSPPNPKSSPLVAGPPSTSRIVTSPPLRPVSPYEQPPTPTSPAYQPRLCPSITPTSLHHHQMTHGATQKTHPSPPYPATVHPVTDLVLTSSYPRSYLYLFHSSLFDSERSIPPQHILLRRYYLLLHSTALLWNRTLFTCRGT
jgi:hypothetical protein